MKKKLFLLLPLTLLSLSSCSMFKGLEHETEVVFKYRDQVISTKTCHEFKNVLVPSLSEEYIPINHEFYGWTWFNPDSINVNDENLDKFYIEKDGVLHYSEIKNYVVNNSVTLQPLFFNIDEIPVPEYYVAIGWYAKTSTSGLNQAKMDKWSEDLKTYLKSEGASDDELNNIMIKGYEGDVATAGSLINKDRFVDVLVGFGGNIGSTGGVELIKNVGGIEMGGKTRYVTLLNEKPISKKVFDWLQTDAGNAALK